MISQVKANILTASQYFTSRWQLQRLTEADTWYMDIWPVALPKGKYQYSLLLILCQDSQSKIFLPCFFGIFPSVKEAAKRDLILRFLKAIKSNTSSMDLSPNCIVLDYVPSLRESVQSLFPKAQLQGAFVHRARLIWKTCHWAKVTEDPNIITSALLALSLLPPDQLTAEFERLRQRADMQAFEKVFHVFDSEFVKPGGRYHSELSYAEHLNSPAFRLSTALLEGYQSRLQRLTILYNVTTLETFVERVLVPEDSFFSSKVSEFAGGPEQDYVPEQFFLAPDVHFCPVARVLVLMHCLLGVPDMWLQTLRLVDGFQTELKRVSLSKFEEHRSAIKKDQP
jgi:hypothetical protein